MMLSQPATLCNVSLYIPDVVYVTVFHTVLSQAVNTVVSDAFDPFIVKSNVIILSHPTALGTVSLYIPLTKYFVPRHSALSHATNIVVSPIF